MPGRALLRPGFETLRGFLEIRERVWIGELFAKLWGHRLEGFPHAEKFAAGLEEEIFVQQPVVEQCAGLFPISEHHANKYPLLASERGDLHGFFERFRAVVLLAPVACLA